jgi:hypothetical protein
VVFFVIATSVGIAQQIRELPTAKITIRAVDESRQSLPGAAVTISFEQPIPKWGGGDALTIKGITNIDGDFGASGHSFDTKGGQVTKEGFYPGWARSVKFEKALDGKWQPWNPTVEVILKKIVNPIPMYARHIETQIPALDAAVGFDLLESDWVAPSGHGKVSDLIFKVSKRVASFHDFGSELQLTFANNGDGVQAMPPDKSGSELRSPHSGPELGYGASISLLQGNSKEHGEYGTKGDNQGYFIRVRTVMDSRGDVASALYGKIYGGIEYFPVSYKTAKLRFTYYLNPTPNDRNIEFDPKRNLFTNLKDDERVTAP